MNYIGSKYSLLDFLETTIADVTGYHNGDNYIFADLIFRNRNRRTDI